MSDLMSRAHRTTREWRGLYPDKSYRGVFALALQFEWAESRIARKP